jgi:hypothetical protein
MAASCGPVSVSTQKDGWAYGANAGPPLSFRWQFPKVAYPFPKTDTNDHGDIRYHRPGAGWKDTFIAMVGGEDTVDRDTAGDTYDGYRRLHGLDVCAGPGGRVRWIADLEAYTQSVSNMHDWGMGPPTVTHGIVFVGTNKGYLLAIADPSIWPAQGSRCTWSNLSLADCVSEGFQVVPRPTVLKALSLPSGEMLRNEPVLARGHVYAATSSGQLHLIAPK